MKAQLARSHEPSFADRIQETLSWVHPRFFDAIGDKNAWGKWVKDARHSIAHRAPGMKDTESDWRTMIRVTASIRWLLVLLLLGDAGLSLEVIEKGVKRHEGLRRLGEQLAAVEPTWFSAPGGS